MRAVAEISAGQQKRTGMGLDKQGQRHMTLGGCDYRWPTAWRSDSSDCRDRGCTEIQTSVQSLGGFGIGTSCGEELWCKSCGGCTQASRLPVAHISVLYEHAVVCCTFPGVLVLL